tara:strand:+ start:1473 stop:1688 length:216 start_codon:yes stop_codon:yes gene_type:complete
LFKKQAQTTLSKEQKVFYITDVHCIDDCKDVVHLISILYHDKWFHPLPSAATKEGKAYQGSVSTRLKKQIN